MKKLISLLTAFTILMSTAIPFTASANSYEDKLRALGFPDSYIVKLSKLHKAHPNWIFEPLFTNLDWYTAVNGERSPHSKQLIQKSSIYNNSMFCNCPSCFVNGKYVVQENGNWISASQEAVESYMNPLNWLDEKNIFQFESTSYDGTQTKQGVEAILQGTWMYDSLITYRTTSGSVKQYDNVTKYSDIIMKAANDFGMSAYYLAAKIKQENGASTASPTAVNGSTSPFQGIYNYFNIGAYTGSNDGLAWAAGFLKTNSKTILYSNYDKNSNTVSGTATSIEKNQYMTWRANKGDYYYVRLYKEVNGKYVEGASGYVPVRDCRTLYLGDTTTGYGRPWTNPAKAIYYGTKYISKSFTTQNSGYLQKFNVSPLSYNKHTNEYMKNVAAAVSESVSTYNGYAKAGILDITKKFSIPIFYNMPNSIDATGLAVTSVGTNHASLAWNGVQGVTAYQIEIFENGQWQYCTATTDTAAYIYNLASCADYKFRVRAYVQNGNDIRYGMYSNEVGLTTMPIQMAKPSASSTDTTVTLKWNILPGASGYSVYRYSDSSKKYKYYKDVPNGYTSSIKLSKLSPKKTYKFKILAYKNINGTKYKGTRSPYVSIKTKSKYSVTLSSAKSSKKKKISVKWKKVSGVTGYQVMWSTSSNFKKNFLSVKVKGSSKTSKTLTTSQSKKNYYVRVRAYKTSKGKTTYYSWSAPKKVKVK